MESPTNEDAAVIENTEYRGVMVLQVAEGEYIIFPHGVKSIADRYEAEAIAVNPDGDIEVLRKGLTDSAPMAWVSVVKELEETKKNG